MAWIRNLHIQQGTRKLKLVVDCSRHERYPDYDIVDMKSNEVIGSIGYPKDYPCPDYRLVDRETNEAIAGLEEVTLEAGERHAMTAHVKLWIDDIEVNPTDVQSETVAEPDRGGI